MYDISELRDKIDEAYTRSIRALARPLRELDYFLKDNQHLFTIIGVFSALSAYIYNLDSEFNPDILQEITVFAGFSVVVLCSAVLIFNLVRQARTQGRIILSWRNIGLLVFASLFVPLSVVLAGFISQYDQFLAAYYLFASYVVGISVSMGYASLTFSFSELVDEKLDWNRGGVLFTLHSLTMVGILYWIARTGYYFTGTAEVLNQGTGEQWLQFLVSMILAWTLFLSGIVILSFLVIGIIGIIALAALLAADTLLTHTPISKIIPDHYHQRIKEEIEEAKTTENAE